MRSDQSILNFYNANKRVVFNPCALFENEKSTKYTMLSSSVVAEPKLLAHEVLRIFKCDLRRRIMLTEYAGSKYVVKLFNPRNQERQYRHELEILEKIDSVDQNGDFPKLVSFAHCCIVLEYRGLTLDEVKDVDFSSVAKGVIRGIRCLQQAGIVHLDLLRHNILCDETRRVTICDFDNAALVGRSICVARGYHFNNFDLLRKVHLLDDFSIPANSDIYGFGLLLLMSYAGPKPFEVDDHPGDGYQFVWLHKNIAPFPDNMMSSRLRETHQPLEDLVGDTCGATPQTELLRVIPDVGLRGLVRRMLSYDPAMRPSIDEVAANPVFNGTPVPSIDGLVIGDHKFVGNIEIIQDVSMVIEPISASRFVRVLFDGITSEQFRVFYAEHRDAFNACELLVLNNMIIATDLELPGQTIVFDRCIVVGKIRHSAKCVVTHASFAPIHGTQSTCRYGTKDTTIRDFSVKPESASLIESRTFRQAADPLTLWNIVWHNAELAGIASTDKHVYKTGTSDAMRKVAPLVAGNPIIKDLLTRYGISVEIFAS